VLAFYISTTDSSIAIGDCLTSRLIVCKSNSSSTQQGSIANMEITAADFASNLLLLLVFTVLVFT